VVTRGFENAWQGPKTNSLNDLSGPGQSSKGATHV
jgi:hypothetical protein